ncbi:hypothetical protein FY528_12005 [Hymenobacter lutimineralis]|uniref:Uncharacterized protein n=1 Tax=Hymenobacter lutimineralis TaxID=2606448 RepID=A0A5D6UYR8_9BACT|nr:hypothetical protein [Hymenobacter lutimineralis]TYZ08931.1 hypothetical protein FY528_12005 [Hymenobacter lutimineralis]
MKTLFSSPSSARVRSACLALFTLVTLGLTQPAQAQQAAPVTLETPTPETLRVRVQNPAQQAGSVQIVSLRTGQSLFRETYTAPVYANRFDFRNLAGGHYSVVLRLGRDQYRYTVHMQPASATSGVVVRTVKARLPKTVIALAAE